MFRGRFKMVRKAESRSNSIGQNRIYKWIDNILTVNQEFNLKNQFLKKLS